MDMDPVYAIAVSLMTAVAGWFGRGWLQHQRQRSEEKQHALDHEATIEQHRDSLTFELLQAARDEVRIVREEIVKLRPFENHFFHLQQALEHLEAVCFSPDEDSRTQAERAAKAFLRRMKRLDEAKGVVLDEAQRMKSAEDQKVSASTLARNEGKESFNNREDS